MDNGKKCDNICLWVSVVFIEHWSLLGSDAHNMMVNIKDAIIDVLQMYIDSKGT